MISFQDIQLLKDKEVANIFGMSHSWVRKERFLRRHNQPHFLTVDPVIIGKSPRYIKDDIEKLFIKLMESNYAVQ